MVRKEIEARATITHESELKNKLDMLQHAERRASEVQQVASAASKEINKVASAIAARRDEDFVALKMHTHAMHAAGERSAVPPNSMW